MIRETKETCLRFLQTGIYALGEMAEALKDPPPNRPPYPLQWVGNAVKRGCYGIYVPWGSGIHPVVIDYIIEGFPAFNAYEQRQAAGYLLDLAACYQIELTKTPYHQMGEGERIAQGLLLYLKGVPVRPYAVTTVGVNPVFDVAKKETADNPRALTIKTTHDGLTEQAKKYLDWGGAVQIVAGLGFERCKDDPNGYGVTLIQALRGLLVEAERKRRVLALAGLCLIEGLAARPGRLTAPDYITDNRPKEIVLRHILARGWVDTLGMYSEWVRGRSDPRFFYELDVYGETARFVEKATPAELKTLGGVMTAGYSLAGFKAAADFAATDALGGLGSLTILDLYKFMAPKLVIGLRNALAWKDK